MILELQRRTQALTEYLVENAGKDPGDDRERTGIIKGYRDFILINFEEAQTDD